LAFRSLEKKPETNQNPEGVEWHNDVGRT
jgi:hypothetical protein